MPRTVVGLDIGGANLKAAHTGGQVLLRPFALWKYPSDLPGALRALLRELPPFDLLAVTMTGELCDCFETKRQGVHAILDAVAQVAGTVPVRVWQTDGRLVSSVEARARPLQTAAANWLALATYVGRFVPKGAALLVDCGSTTTDVIPLLDGQPVPRGRTDPERLRKQELVYTGVQRTPLCALLGAGGAAELFATTSDVYIYLGTLPERPDDRDTADGRPATRACAAARLARMVCGDLETVTPDELTKLAQRVLLLQAHHIRSAMQLTARALPAPPTALVLAGSGEFVVRALLTMPPEYESKLTSLRHIVSLAQELGPTRSAAACAHALAVLASEADDGSV